MAGVYGKQQIFELLEQKGIAFEKLEHDVVCTMEEMDAAGITAKGTVCKNLFLRDFKGKNHFLVTVPEHKKVDMRDLAAQIGSSKLSFGSAERLDKYLGLTQGSVSPLGLLNDDSKSVVMVFDKDLKSDEEVGVHPNDNSATLWLSFDSLRNIIEEHGNQILFVQFPEYSE